MSAHRGPGQPVSTSDPTDAPIRGISFGGAFARYFQKYATFSGRASRSEFWWMALWAAIYSIVLWAVLAISMIPPTVELLRSDSFNTETPEASLAASAALWGLMGRFAIIWIVVIIIGLALVLPTLALIVRRLHDSDKSGHLAWLLLIPSVGNLIVLILCLMPEEARGQRFDRAFVRA